jgi:isopenicillin N synthase-like dioxygenase
MIAGSPDVAAVTDIPIVDFAGFSSPDPAVRAATAASIRHAFENVGFLYIANHGVPQAVLDRVRAEAEIFFARPLEEKQPLRWEGPGISTGYIGIAGQVHDQTRPYDLMEAYNAAHELSGRQMFWPAGRPEFRAAVMAYHDVARQAAERVLQAVAVAYGLPERYFTAFHDEYRGTARLLHYPPITETPAEGQLRAGAHTDFGTVTLLFQDDVGGLEIQRADGSWRPAPPIPGTAVVNAGDLMERWTNGLFRSTMHRVVNPVGEAAKRPRYSLVFFYSPNPEALIECLEPCQGPDHPARYPPVLARDHVKQRHDSTYRSPD